MNTAYKIIRQRVAQTVLVCLAFGQLAQTARAASTDLANVPMAVNNSVTPNVLVILDNSESMDGYMAGTLVSGNNPGTRGNVGRSAMRNLAITPYRTAFNWGLMSFATSGPSLMETYAYYMGSDAGMVFTNDCVGYVAGVFNGAPAIPGVSASNGNRRCIGIPPQAGFSFVTFDSSGDDYNINDVLYYYSGYAGFWAPTNALNSGSYNLFQNHVATVSTWNNPADFSASAYSGSFGSTDAGFVPWNPPITRQVYLPRGWGYLAGVTGAGTLNEAVMADSTTHYNTLLALLANETNGATGEIKNAAVFTPTVGTLGTAGAYFSGSSTPVTAACQQNFVMFVTDGLPTADTTGSMYSAANRTSTCSWSTTTNSCTTGALSTAVNDVNTQITALRATTVPGFTSTQIDGTQTAGAKPSGKYDIQTYIVGLGDTVVNANNLSAMNAMAYNGGGTNQALLATDTATFNTAINQITSNITAKVGASAALSISTPLVTNTNNISYASRYNSGTWTGDLGACSIDITTNACPTDPVTGKPVFNSLWTAGSAQAQLDKLSYIGATYVPSNASTVRLIATSTDTVGVIGGVQFQSTAATTATKLSVGQQTLLNTPGTTDGVAVVAYLRGDKSGETAGIYRARAHLLGDIVDAESLPVNAPSRGYADAGYQGSTTTFKEANAGRIRMVYQGANDGMLHAFNAATGAEAWAYVPNLVISNLNNLSNKTGFIHTYLVDGSPVSGDVDFKNCCTTGSGNDWHTILVGGLGKGGRGYYALDVTCPTTQGNCTTAATEADIANKVLWEFPNSVTNSAQRNAAKLNTGYTFGKPIIVKTRATGWVVLVTSGYNNGTNAGDSGGNGLGHLYVLNPKTGDLLKDIPTTGCTTTSTFTPCGLAQISAYVENIDVDNTTDFVYGGDLMGNVWRFDLSGPSVASWAVAKFAVLKDAGGVTQPITTTPELAKYLLNSIAYRFVYVGTGQYLGNTDVPGTGQNSHAIQTQTMYGLVDTTTSPLPDPLRGTLQAQTLATDNTTTPPTRTATNNKVNFATQNGWYVDLPDSGERANTDPTLGSGVLNFTTNIPSSTICVPGGSSWRYQLDYRTGGVIPGSAVAISLGNVLASRVVLYPLSNGQEGGGLSTSLGETKYFKLPAPNNTPSAKRISWREIIVQ